MDQYKPTGRIFPTSYCKFHFTSTLTEIVFELYICTWLGSAPLVFERAVRKVVELLVFMEITPTFSNHDRLFANYTTHLHIKIKSYQNYKNNSIYIQFLTNRYMPEQNSTACIKHPLPTCMISRQNRNIQHAKGSWLALSLCQVSKKCGEWSQVDITILVIIIRGLLIFWNFKIKI